MSAMGIKIENFSVPVCNSFQAKIHNDQLCYKVDPNWFMSYENIEKDFRAGLTFLVDYNEDRQLILEVSSNSTSEYTLMGNFENNLNDEKMAIYLSTIGNLIKSDFYYMVYSKLITSEPMKLYGEGQYNLNVVKEVAVTNSFMGFDTKIIGCQQLYDYEDCKTSHYLKSFLDNCKCLPFNLMIFEKVD